MLDDIMKMVNDHVVVRQVVISVLVLLFIVIVWVCIRHIRRAYQKEEVPNERMRAAGSLKSVFYDTIKVAIVALIVLVILQINGVNVTSLIAGFGVASAIIGLALQDFFKDIIMGIHILMDDFFQLGDVVQYLDDEGIVEGFNLRTTKIRSIRDGSLHTICNRNIDHIVQSSNEVYIHQLSPYDLPSGRAVEVMQKCAERVTACEGITSCVLLGLTGFEGSAADYLVKLILEKPEEKLPLRREALRVIRTTLEEEKIAIPYERVNVHMK